MGNTFQVIKDKASPAINIFLTAFNAIRTVCSFANQTKNLLAPLIAFFNTVEAVTPAVICLNFSSAILSAVGVIVAVIQYQRNKELEQQLDELDKVLGKGNNLEREKTDILRTQIDKCLNNLTNLANKLNEECEKKQNGGNFNLKLIQMLAGQIMEVIESINANIKLQINNLELLKIELERTIEKAKTKAQIKRWVQIVGITVGFACALGALGAIGAAIFTESVAWLLAAVSLGGIAAGAFYGHHEIETKIDELNLQVQKAEDLLKTVNLEIQKLEEQMQKLSEFFNKFESLKVDDHITQNYLKSLAAKKIEMTQQIEELRKKIKTFNTECPICKEQFKFQQGEEMTSFDCNCLIHSACFKKEIKTKDINLKKQCPNCLAEVLNYKKTHNIQMPKEK